MRHRQSVAHPANPPNPPGPLLDSEGPPRAGKQREAGHNSLDHISSQLTKGKRIAMRRKKLESLPNITATQLAMLKDAAAHADERCMITLGRGSWAKMVRRSVRTIDRNIDRMLSSGVLTLVKKGSGGDPRETSQYLVPCFLEVEGQAVGVRPTSVTVTRVVSHPTRATMTPEPVSSCPSDPCHHDTQTVKTEQTTATGAAAAAIALLRSDELLREYGPSPEQLAAIANVAATKRDPGAYAATCIRKGITPKLHNTPKAKRLRAGLE